MFQDIPHNPAAGVEQTVMTFSTTEVSVIVLLSVERKRDWRRAFLKRRPVFLATVNKRVGRGAGGPVEIEYTATSIEGLSALMTAMHIDQGFRENVLAEAGVMMIYAEVGRIRCT